MHKNVLIQPKKCTLKRRRKNHTNCVRYNTKSEQALKMSLLSTKVEDRTKDNQTQNRHKIQLIQRRRSEIIQRDNLVRGKPSRKFDDTRALSERDIGAAEHSEDSTHGGERLRDKGAKCERWRRPVVSRDSRADKRGENPSFNISRRILNQRLKFIKFCFCLYFGKK